MSSLWEEVHPDLLYEIGKRLISSEDEEGRDLKAFGMVCSSWRSVWFQFKQNPKQMWLMLAEDGDSTKRSFYNLADGNVFNMNLPECSKKQCIYFTETKGWLITCGQDSEVNLLNLFTRVQIKLPSFSILNDLEEVVLRFPYFILRAALSADPSHGSDFTVIILYWTGMLAFARPGDKIWRVLPKPNNFCDAIFYNGRVYAADWRGSIWVCDNIGDSKSEPVATKIRKKRPISVSFVERMYLFESSGKLFAAFRGGVQVRPIDEHNEDEDSDHEYNDDELTYGCKGFKVYELNLSKKRWMKVKSLENKALFVGHNTSMCVPASTIYGCKPNCIYFTDDCEETYLRGEGEKEWRGGKDMGVYNLKDGSIEPHFKKESLSRICPPLWIFPNII